MSLSTSTLEAIASHGNEATTSTSPEAAAESAALRKPGQRDADPQPPRAAGLGKRQIEKAGAAGAREAQRAAARPIAGRGERRRPEQHA